jgi:N-hydroxyarylamine O-acetyltransferase
MDDTTVEAYLERIGVTRPAVLDAATLAVLHRAHLTAVPFENLSLHLAEPISLETPDLIDKIVTRRRGGFCYELNGTFALLLRALGADVSLAGAAVFGEDRLGPPFDHLALIVHLPEGGGRWLADVGFGDHSVYPLDLADRQEQTDPGGLFQLIETVDGDLDVFRDAMPQYRLELRKRSLNDFGPTCWYQQTSPASHFTKSTICSRLTDSGRISLSGRTLIRTVGGARSEEELTTDDDVLAAYRDHFGVHLDRVPHRQSGEVA